LAVTAACLSAVALLAARPAVATPSPAAIASTLTARFAAMTARWGWTGGDASWSVLLPDGRTAWAFGDTFLGGVDATGRRSRRTPMVHNSIVIEPRDGPLQTMVGDTRNAGATADLVPSRSASDWYWPGPPIVTGATLEMPMAHIARTGPGPWEFRQIGTVLAAFSLPAVTLRSVRPIRTPPAVGMAAAVYTDARHTYIYGTRDVPHSIAVKDAYVARVPVGRLQSRWRYWNGLRWSPGPADAVPIARGVSNQFSVLRRDHRTWLITQKPLTRSIVALRSTAPQGPWHAPTTIGTIPDIPSGFTYNATIHLELPQNRSLLLGYNVNATEESDLWTDAALYRPRFMTVRLPRS
jgi:hypothetical protein